MVMVRLHVEVAERSYWPGLMVGSAEQNNPSSIIALLSENSVSVLVKAQID